MRRRNLIIASDSDEEDGDAATTASASASASVSVASGGGGGSICRPSSRSPSPFPAPYEIPSSPPPSPPIEIFDYEEEVDEIQDPDGDSPFLDVPDGIQGSDGDSPFVDVSEDFSPPILAPPARTPTPTPHSAPPARTLTPSSAPAPAPPARTPAPTPLSAPVPAPPARTSIPNLPSAPAPLFRVPTSTPSSARTPTPTPPSARTPTPTLSSVHTPTLTPRPISTPLSGRLRQMDEFLRRLGMSVRQEWLESCAAGVPGFDGLGSTEAQARRCFEQFLFADMNACGAGALPEGVGCMNAAILEGPFMLQVDEIVNISAPLRERYREAHAGPKRCLKLSMTDGVQRLYGMEYRPIKDLDVLAPVGFKIVIRNVHIRRGLFMLVPEVIEILGGNVDELEAARDRLVSEVNKPPRGKRKQGGLHLSSRAMLAAWVGNINVTSGGEQGISMPRTVNPFHATGLGNASQADRTAQPLVEEHVNPPVIVSGVQEQSRHFQDFTMQDLPTSVTMDNTEDSAPVTYQYDPAQSIDRTAQTLVEEYADHPIVANNVHEQIPRVQEIIMQDQPSATTSNREPSASTPCGYDSQQGPHGIGGTGTNAAEGARSSNVDDEIYQMEHPVILSGENEKPFTYIFSMLADWGVKQDMLPYIQGKIKGLITCVKHFNFKQCKEYDLYVYIDDGSYISEAYVDRDVVQSIIGHSSKEVSAALYSGDSASADAMKQTMSGFRRFLVNFEGTMLIEFNRKSSVPVVRAMNEGCLSSDAWLLLRRMKTFSAERHMRSLDFMDTTP